MDGPRIQDCVDGMASPIRPRDQHIYSQIFIAHGLIDHLNNLRGQLLLSGVVVVQIQSSRLQLSMNNVSQTNFLVSQPDDFSGFWSRYASFMLSQLDFGNVEDLITTQDIASKHDMNRGCAVQLDDLRIFLVLELIADGKVSRDHSV